MKTILFVLISLSFQPTLFGQITIDEFYEDVGNLLIQSRVETFDSLGVEELKRRFKNWGSTQFVNLREITVSETEDQIVLNYITESFYGTFLGMRNSPLEWYIRMVVQFKEDRIRILVYDDGNTFWVSSMNTVTPARTYKLNHYFNNSGTPKTNFRVGLENLKQSVNVSIIHMVETMKKESKETVVDDDWK